MAEVGLEKLTGGMSIDSLRADFADMGVYLIWGLVIIAVLFFAYKKYQDKKIYIYPVRIFRERNNGIVKEINSFGGYIKKGQITQFIIKMGAFKKRPASKLPLSNLMDEDNRVYYFQVSPESPLIQVKREFKVDKILVPNEEFTEPTKEEIDNSIKSVILKLKENENYKELSDEDLNSLAKHIVDEEIEENKNKFIDITIPTYTPIPTDLKQQALLEIANYRNTLGVDVNKQFAYFVIGVIALLVLGAVIFYIAVNKGALPILTDSFLSLINFPR